MRSRLRDWLQALGLEHLAPMFEEHQVDFRDLKLLTDDDLKEIGLALGPRKRLLKAIEDLAQSDALENASPREKHLENIIPERRQLTVMFVDLVESTELAGRLDVEKLREVLLAYQEACANAIGQFEGQIGKYIGDGVLAYFGYPQAHEDDPFRAVSAALAIVDQVERLSRSLSLELGIELRVRVGVHTGLVIAGEMGGRQKREPQAIVGETANLAARLEGLAQPNTIAISDVTYSLVEGLFECVNLGPQRLKGITEPVPVHRVLGEARVMSRFEAAAERGLGPIVGREEELGLLLNRWGRAKDGESQVVFLSGDAGLGKSRIARSFRDSIKTEAHSTILCFCSAFHQNSALYPVIGQLQQTLRFSRDDGPTLKLDRLKTAIGELGLKLDDAVPALANLLSVPLGSNDPLDGLSPQELKTKTLEALISVLAAMSSAAPVVMVVEDAHWIDPSTSELLGLAIDRLTRARLLLIITHRPDFRPSWTDHGNITQLTLNRLGRRDAVAMVENISGGKALPSELLDQIITRADGVPLFLEELTRTLLESGALSENESGYTLLDPIANLEIPFSLKDSLMARLDRLGPAKAIAQRAAVIGRTFDEDLLVAISDHTEAEIDAAMEVLCSSGLIYPVGPGAREAFEFKHALVRDAAYDSLLRSNQKEYHRRIAEVLEKKNVVATTEPETIAYHFDQAGHGESALEYWQKAAQLAIQKSANIEAERYLEKAFALLVHLPETMKRRRRESELLNTLGVCLMPIRGFGDPEVADAFTRAASISESLNDSRGLFVALRGLGQYQMISGNLRKAAEQTQRIMSFAGKLSDRGALIEAHHLGWITLTFAGKFDAARAHASEGYSLYEIDHDHELTYGYSGHDPGVCCRSFGALPMLQLGYPDQALRMCEDGQKLADSLSHPFSTGVALWASCLVRHLRRDYDKAFHAASSLIELSEDGGFSLLLAQGKMLRGCSVAAQGDLAVGIQEIQEGMEQFRAGGAQYSLPCFLGVLGQYFGEMGKPEQGLLSIKDGMAIAAGNGDHFNLPELYRIKGELLLTISRGNHAEAKACFQKAIDVAAAQKARLLKLRACVSLAALDQKMEEASQAMDLLASAYGRFDEGFGSPDLREAKAILKGA